MKSNCELFPNNIYEPKTITRKNSTPIKLYLARFNSLYDLYDYLKSNPNINREVFSELASEKNDYNFAGKPYEEALEDLISDIDPGYSEFLKLQGNLNQASDTLIHKYKTVKTLSGGRLNVPAYSAGSPLCYETEERIIKPRFVKMHVALSYYCGTSKEQVYNRAIIITNVLKALEKSGYNVDLNTFELSSCYQEFIHIIVSIKKYGSKMNMQALYKTLCHVEFLRRILFRVLETMDVKENWCDGYGTTCSENLVRNILKLGKNDILFDQPREMGIRGRDLANDFESAIKHLNLEDKIDIEKAKREFAEKVKILKK